MLWRGTGKAEDAKLPGAGISPKPCPRKWAEEKNQVPESVISVWGAPHVELMQRRAFGNRTGPRKGVVPSR